MVVPDLDFILNDLFSLFSMVNHNMTIGSFTAKNVAENSVFTILYVLLIQVYI
jgi:hypothetical protein